MSAEWPGWGPKDNPKAEQSEYRGEAIDHPDIEWELTAIPRFVLGAGVEGRAVTDWDWVVVCEPTGQRLTGTLDGESYYSNKKRALRTINAAAYSLLARPRVVGRTNPCVLCAKSSMLGSLTCGPDHERALAKARQELAQLPGIAV